MTPGAGEMLARATLDFWRQVDFAAQISGLVPVVALVTLAGRTNAFMQGTTLLNS